MTTERNCCGGCKYFSREFVDDPEGDVGECLRYPPLMVNIPDRQLTDHEKIKYKAFPIISYVRWCGEWMADRR